MGSIIPVSKEEKEKMCMEYLRAYKPFRPIYTTHAKTKKIKSYYQKSYIMTHSEVQNIVQSHGKFEPKN